jgi:hypothetical protein
MKTVCLARWQEKPQITRPCGRVGIMSDWLLVRESNKSRELSKFPDNS